MSTYREILEILAALLTPTIGIVGAIVLVNQYKLEKLRWRLALYDKRYPVYLATVSYIANIVARHNVTNEELDKFLRESRDRDFLFGKDIRDFLDQLYQKGVDLHTYESTSRHLPKGKELERRVEESSRVFQWFQKQFATARTLFGEYLSVDKK